ncbi:MAG: S1 RNA-binding domain-containing protein [Chloroflexi bacterium]|nr:MAG: S1 RNA-binding domain-containing protein [Chloroflexota bacterium]
MTTEVQEHPWEAPLDEAYWQALLQQEEQAPPAPEVHDMEEWPEILIPGEGAVAGPDYEMGRRSLRESPDGHFDDARDEQWRWLHELYDKREVTNARVIGCNKGGLLVRLGACIGFVPASQLVNVPECLGTEELRGELEAMVGQEIQVKLIELDRSRNRIICSERATAWSDDEITARLEALQPGQVIRGEVRSLCEFGAFIDLGGIDGLIHISELSWERVGHPRDVLEVGQEVEVYVLNVDPAQRRIGLSLKRLQPDPWMLVEERYQVGDVIDVVITNVVDFGAFAKVPEGVEGLIHISELAEGHFLHARNVVQEGDRVSARILNIDPEGRRLGLSLRQV